MHSYGISSFQFAQVRFRLKSIQTQPRTTVPRSGGPSRGPLRWRRWCARIDAVEAMLRIAGRISRDSHLVPPQPQRFERRAARSRASPPKLTKRCWKRGIFRSWSISRALSSPPGRDQRQSRALRLDCRSRPDHHRCRRGYQTLASLRYLTEL